MKGQIPYVDNNYDNRVEQNNAVSFYNDTNLATLPEDDFSSYDNNYSNYDTNSSVKENVIPFKKKPVDNNSYSSYDANSSAKATIIPFKKKQVDSITMQEWLTHYHTQGEYQTLFINMDLAMKYIHDQDYYIESFALDTIEILNHSVKQIKFNQLHEMPLDLSSQKNIVRDNIFLSAVLQIGVYANCLPYFRGEAITYLKQNFGEFSIFLPEEDVPYYKGVIERGASVYFSSYVGERKKRDLNNLDQQINDEGAEKGKSLVKTNGTSLSAEDLVPQNISELQNVYGNLSKKDAAFARALIYPVLILLVGLTVLLLSYLLS